MSPDIHSVRHEPHLRGEGLAEPEPVVEGRRASLGMALGLAVVAGVISGPFSIIGTLLSGNPGYLSGGYIIFFGPAIEEMMKLSGLLYLLEKKPWVLRYGWQFPLCAAISALIFAVIENFIYQHFYLDELSRAERENVLAVRWAVTPVLHVGATMVGSLGLLKVWREQRHPDLPVDLTGANKLVFAAVAIHGGYNLVALLLSGWFTSF